MSATDFEFELLDDSVLLSAVDLARACNADEGWIEQLVAHGVIEPIEQGSTRYSAICLLRLRKARRLERDFSLNASGLALVLDLLDEVERLRRRSSGLAEHQ